MLTKLSTKYNPFARDLPDELFLLDEEFDQFETMSFSAKKDIFN